MCVVQCVSWYIWAQIKVVLTASALKIKEKQEFTLLGNFIKQDRKFSFIEDRQSFLD